MKKLLCLALAAVLCIFCVACTGKGGDETTPISTQATPQSTGEPEGSSAPAADATSGDATSATDPADVTTEAPAGPATVPEADAVCSIGSDFYGTLADAFTVVKAGETINITKDFTTNEHLYTTSEGQWSINGNGHKITAQIDTIEGFIQVEYCTIDVVNLKIDYKEELMGVSNGQLGCAAFSVGAEDTVNLTHADIVAYWGDGLNIDSEGTIVINSGSYAISLDNAAPQSNLICLNGTGKLIVKDGTFSRNGVTGTKRALIRCNGAGQTLTIEGGVWESSCGRILYNNGSASADALRNFTISGGTFTLGVADPSSYTYDPAFQFGTGGGVNLTISGGTFEIKAGCPMTFFNCSSKNTNVVITDGTFVNGSSDLLLSSYAATAEDAGSVITVKGGTFTNTSGHMLSASNIAGGVVIEGGTFNTANADDAAAVKAIAGTGAVIK